MSQCGLLKDMSEKERVQGKWAPEAKKNTKCLENYPQGSLTKQRRCLQGKGIFIENKKGMRTLPMRLGRPQTVAGEVEKMLTDHVILKQN